MRVPDSWNKAPLTLAIAVATAVLWVLPALFQVDAWVAAIAARSGRCGRPSSISFRCG